MTATASGALLKRGFLLEYATLGWNVVGVVVLAVLALDARSPALAGFGIDSLIEIGASLVVVWELSGAPRERERRAMRLIGVGFVLLAVYLVGQIALVIAGSLRPSTSPLGIVWTALTFVVMLLLAEGKQRTGLRLGNEVLRAEGRVTRIDAALAAAVLVGLALNSLLGWWWADPAAGLVLVFYAVREAVAALRHDSGIA
jgi:divalent metal cation (Fe/Co/Zn/Cd) transporter